MQTIEVKIDKNRNPVRKNIKGLGNVDFHYFDEANQVDLQLADREVHSVILQRNNGVLEIRDIKLKISIF